MLRHLLESIFQLNRQIIDDAWGGSHALLWGGYQAARPDGDIATEGAIK